MSYRRDNTEDEHIPLPIETVYNSIVDSVRVKGDYGTTKYYTDSNEHFNRIYFKYPAEWRTSNLGEKIIGVRHMSVKWRTGWIKFDLFVRKFDNEMYDKLRDVITRVNKEICETLSEDEIHEIVMDNLPDEYVRVYQIPISIRVTSNDNWIDIVNHIRKAIDDHNLYNHLKEKIMDRKITPDERTTLLKQLEDIKDDYESMLAKSDELIGEHIPFYLQSEDIIIEDVFENNQHILKLRSKDSHLIDLFRSTDILITRPNNTVLHIGSAYSNFYNGHRSVNFIKHRINHDGRLIPYEEPEKPVKPDIGEEEEDWNEPIDEDDIKEQEYNNIKFDPYTASFFNIGSGNPFKNNIYKLYHYHHEQILKNILTDLECEVVASFATQSNHYLVGRTNEPFCPIKYYKLNHSDETFWIEFYDKNEIKIPLPINDNVVFTMDMVFLQNRKLLYS